MKNVTKHEQCHTCLNSVWHEANDDQPRRLLCPLKRCPNFSNYERPDWRDYVMLENELAGMTLDERRMMAEEENPHIVQVQKQIKRERIRKIVAEKNNAARTRQLLEHIKKQGGIDGYKLIRHT